MSRDIELLIKKIREEERKKILEEIEQQENQPKAWESIAEYMDSWGEENEIYQWHLCKLKNAVYTIIRYTLDIDRISNLGAEQMEMALQVAKVVLGIVKPTRKKRLA